MRFPRRATGLFAHERIAYPVRQVKMRFALVPFRPSIRPAQDQLATAVRHDAVLAGDAAVAVVQHPRVAIATVAEDVRSGVSRKGDLQIVDDTPEPRDVTRIHGHELSRSAARPA